MQALVSVIGILLFVSLVVVHEWGHYIAARRNGVETEEFGIGLPPRAWGKKLKSGMIFSLNWLPLGGFVKLKGEHDSDTRKGSFGAASLSAKSRILLAGVTMNLLVGLLILTILALTGMPKLLDKQTGNQDQYIVASDTKVIASQVHASAIETNSPADHIGLKTRDSITVISAGNDRRVITTPESLAQATKHFAGQTVTVTFIHGRQNVTKSVKLRSQAEIAASLKTDSPKGYLGVDNPFEMQVRRSTWSAPIVAIGFTGQLVNLTAQGLWHALSGLGSTISGLATGNHEARENGQSQATAQVGGPVAIASILWGSGALGFSFMLIVIAIISLTLAIMNILPIPALDGGRLFMLLFSRGVLRRPLSRTAEERITATGMVLILALILLITIVDVHRFF